MKYIEDIGKLIIIVFSINIILWFYTQGSLSLKNAYTEDLLLLTFFVFLDIVGLFLIYLSKKHR